MKRITVLSMSMFILLLGSLLISPVTSGNGLGENNYDLRTNNTLGPDQTTSEGSYYPIFVNATSTGAEQVRERNNTLGEGAIVQVQEKANVTFYYAVALQNTSDFVSSTVDFRLFGDLPEVNDSQIFNNTVASVELSLSNSALTVPLEYTNTNTTNNLDYVAPDGSTIDNATLYIFANTIQINMTVSYLPFYVEDLADSSNSEEANNGAHNLLTTQEYHTTNPQDEFFIQNEIVNITGNLFFDDDGDNRELDLGIFYRVNGGALVESNFSLVYDNNNATANITLTDYEIGTEISWESVLFVANDTLINKSRIITNIDSKSVEIGDGTPELDIQILSNDETGFTLGNTTYSTNFSITFIIETSVPKGNITDLFLLATVDDDTPKPFDKFNDSYSVVPINQTIDYSEFTEDTLGGQFNTTIVTNTDKGIQVNRTFTIIIDQVDPVISGVETNGGNNLVTSDGRVTFSFGFSDDNSGVRMAILDFGDNSSVEVTDLNSYVHKYENFDGKTFQYTLTIYDYAGNSDVNSGIVTLNRTPLEDDNANPYQFIIFIVVFLAAITSPKWGPWVVEKINERR